MKSKLLLIFFTVISIYCNAQRLYSEEQQKRYLPKKEKRFKLSKHPFILSDTVIVSSNCVYVSSEYLCGQKCDSLFTYMRFFHDGRVFISFPYLNNPSIEELNDLNYGKYGRYIVKEGELIVEIYMDREYGQMFMFAEPVITGIQFYAIAPRLRALIKKRNKDRGFYRKEYTKLYNWPK